MLKNFYHFTPFILTLNCKNKIFYNFVNLPIKSKYYHKQLPTQLNQVLKLIKRQNTLNQKCFLLQHLSDLMVKDRKIYLSSEQRKIVSEEINKWKNQSGRFQHIATVAWVIKRLNLQKIHQELFDQIKERFTNDQWYVNFDESVKALEVFKDLPEGEQKKTILQKIQRNIQITMWNVHMKYYERIATGLLEAGRFKSELWQRMEKQILQNLGMHYQTRTLCNIFKAYAISYNGHDVFYQMMQKVLFQGHFNQYNFLNYKNFSKQYDDSGQFFSLVIQTYSIANKSCGVILTPQFKDYVYDALMDKKTEYKQLSSLSKTINSLQNFDFEPEQIKQVEQILLQKRPTQFTLKDIKDFYQLMQYRHGQIPSDVHSYIQSILIKDIKSKFVPATDLVDFVNYLLEKQYIQDKKLFIDEVNYFLESNFKYLYSQEAKYVIQTIKEIKKIQIQKKKQDLLKLPEYINTKSQNKTQNLL